MEQYSYPIWQEFYADLKGKSHYGRQVSFMNSGPVVVMLIEGFDAVKNWRELQGPTDPQQAREVDSKSIRALFGTELPSNATHGSDSKQAVIEELSILIPTWVSAVE